MRRSRIFAGRVPLPNDAQALERQKVIDILDVFRSGADHGAKSAGRDDASLRA